MNIRVGTTQKTLSDLNDDCLHHILSFLPVLDKVILGNCLGEDRVLKVLSKQDVFYIEDCMRRLTLDETKQILDRFGYQIKNISLDSDFTTDVNVRYFELIAAHCRNLEYIPLFYLKCESELKIFQKILFTNKSLESISVTAEDKRLQHQLLSIIENMRGIKYLRFPLLDIMSGAEISQMTNLIGLNITCCELFREDNFIKLMNGNNLKILDISNCDLLQAGALQALCDTQHELECLIISSTSYLNYESIGQLKKLKQLILSEFNEDEIISVAKGIANLPNLEFLQISNIFKCPKVAKIFLSRIVSLKNLKFLYLPRYQRLNHNDLRAIALKIPNLEELTVNIGRKGSANANGLIALIRDLKNLQKCQVAPVVIRLNLDLLRRFIEAKKQGNPQPLKIYWGGGIDKGLLKSALHLGNLNILEVRPQSRPFRNERFLDWVNADRWGKDKPYFLK